MTLLSPWLIVLLGFVAVATAAVTVWLWPRLARTTPLSVLGRVGSLLAVNVTVLLLAFALLNDQFMFFGDWADLLGTASMQSTIAEVGAQPSTAVAAAALGSKDPVGTGSATVVRTVTDGTIYAVAGGASGVTSQVLVVLPQGYNDPVNARRRYPVLLGFGGYPGVVTSFPHVFRIRNVLDGLHSRRALGPVIAVFVQPWSPPGRDTECVNGPGGVGAGDQIETWSAIDVPAWLSAHFRTATSRNGWATWGISAGAWCATMVTMLHPATFSAAISLAGYFRPDWGNWHPFAAGDPLAHRYDLVALAGSSSAPPVALWIFTTKVDSFGSTTKAFLGAARRPLSVTADIASSGGHRLATWIPWVPVAMTWLGKNIPGFAPLP